MNDQSSAMAMGAAADTGRSDGGREPRAPFWPAFALLVVTYSLAAAAGLQWATVSGAASPIWPAAGVAVACMLHAGRRVWPGIVVGLLIATQASGADHPLWSQVMMGFGNAAAAVVVAMLVQRFGGQDFQHFATTRSVLLLLAAALIGASLSAANGTAALMLAGKLDVAQAPWVLKTWLFGDAAGILIVAAMIISWRAARRSDWHPLKVSHLVFACVVVALLSWWVFFGPTKARAWAIYPALVWAALALRVQGASVALVIAAVVACLGTAYGHGPFALGIGSPDYLLLQQFLMVTSATTMLLAAAVDERNAEVKLRETAAKELATRTELQRAETMLELIGASAPIALYAKDTDGRYLYANAAVASATGTRPGELVGKTDAAWAQPDIAASLAANDAAAMASAAVQDSEEVIRHPDGALRTYRALKAPLRDRDGTVIGLVGVSTDVTERKRVEEQIARLAERAEIAQQAARSSLYEYDPESGIVTRDPLIHELAGYSAEEMSGNLPELERMIHPDDLPEFQNTVAKAMARADRYAMEYRIKRKDGSDLWVSDVGRVIRDERGKVQRLIGMASDITERRLAQEELQRTTSLLTLIGNSATGLIFAKDLDGRYIYANQRVADVVRQPLESLIGRDDAAWTTPEIAETFARVDRRVMATGRSEELDEVVPYPDGSQRLFRSLKAPLRDSDGQVIGIVGVSTDVTERKAAEEREQLLAREVDHRAKNLLAVVQSVVQMSRADDIRAFKAGVTGRIQSLARAHSLLADARWEGVSLQQIVVEELAPFHEDHRHRVEVSGPPIRLTPAAAQSLALVLHELATNAAKYGALSREQGEVRVGWSLDEDGAARLSWVEMSDVAARPPSRAGFGSRLIQASVERQLRGTLAYHWGEQGLTVALVIPPDHLLPGSFEAAPPVAAPPASIVPAVVARPASCRILIVEDEALIGLQLEQALEAEDCTVVGVAGTVAEAMRLIEDERPDGALLDINLDGETSFPVAERLDEAGVPFVFCTGYAGDLIVPDRFRSVPVIRKPFDAAAIATLFAGKSTG